MVESGEWTEEKEEDDEGEALSHGSLYADEDPCNLSDEDCAFPSTLDLPDRNRDPDAWKQRRKSRRAKTVYEETSIGSVNEVPSGDTGNTEQLLASPPSFMGKLNKKNYFGAPARSSFFSLYQK